MISIKMAGEWMLDVLACPFGSPTQPDSHGEWFSPATNFHEDHIPLPPVVYYHGYHPDSTPQGDPSFIGRTIARHIDNHGVWYRVLLDRSNHYAQRVWQAAQRGLARASTGTMAHLRRVDPNGHIRHWLVSELSLFDRGGQRQPANQYAVALPVLKARYQQAGITLPLSSLSQGEHTMEEKTTITMTKDDLVALLREVRDVPTAPAHTAPYPQGGTTKQAIDTLIHTAIQQARAEWEREHAPRNRLPIGEPGWGTPLKYGELRKYDSLSAADQAILCGVLLAPHRGSSSRPIVSATALKALSFKLEEDTTDIGELGRSAMKAAGIKANEVGHTNAADYGEEWISMAYSTALWHDIRHGTFATQMIRNQEVRPGSDTMIMPLESTDPAWYRISEATDGDYSATTRHINATIPSQALGTASTNLTLRKMGARSLFTGELDEDSLIPVVAQLREQLAVSGAENLEHAIIDGDTTNTAGDNINSSGTPTNQIYTLFDGFRHAAIINGGSATSRSAEGAPLAATDFLNTAQLLGTAGVAAIDPAKIGFIIPLSLHWKIMALAELLTADKIANPTIDGGMITRIYGIPLFTSAQMLRTSAKRLSQNDGTIHDTDTNNTLSQLLCVRWDQWVLGWRRRMLIETNRIPSADATEIVATMRVGLVFRNKMTAAAATYNISVATTT